MNEDKLNSNDRLAVARESFSGRILTNRQYEEVVAIVGILERRIEETGAFTGPLADYAFIFSRSESFDAARGEVILRDLFKELTGKTMNQLRESLVEKEEQLGPETRELVGDRIEAMAVAIRTGTKMTFYRAYAQEAQVLAGDLGITEAAAKRLMKDEFADRENGDLYNWGKELEDKHYRPQIDAEKAEKQRSDNRRASGPSDDAKSDQTRSQPARGNGRGETSGRRYRTGPTP